MAFALTGARIFDGSTMRHGMAVVINDARIVEIVPERKISPAVEQRPLQGGLLAPGFIDVQVNGGGGALFNQDPSVETLKRIATSHRKFGTTGMLPTLITDTPQVLAQGIEAVKKARVAKTPGILGIHIEGPFLDSERKGAHDARYIRPMTTEDVQQISAVHCGVVMLTLAPNRVSPEVIKKLSDQGVFVSLGHSNATFKETQAALQAGASAFTHIYNAMSQLTGREPGMVGAALADRESFCGLIADGYHVCDTAMKIAIAAKINGKIMLVTDAMATAADGPQNFELQRRRVSRVDGRLVLEDGTLAGSNLTMDQAVRYCVNKLDVKLEDALRMASLNPATFMRCDHELGRIEIGYLASLVHLNDELGVFETWIEGR